MRSVKNIAHYGSCIAVLVSAFPAQPLMAAAPKALDEIVITATREEKSRDDVAASVDVMAAEEIEQISPSHPAEALNRIAGVHINNLGGEGHMSAIRQPITTGGVYLFLEDGIPTRPTGFFNHNGLYEINIPQAQRIEVVKGPGSALYGSDAIGGVIHSITKPSPDKQEITTNAEVGSYGWKRLLLSGGAPINDMLGFRLDLNLTDNEGYRDDSSYGRASTTLRVDGFINDYTSFKTIASYTQVDQSGVSSLEVDDYHNNTRKNRFHGDIGFRDVEAFRLSTEFAYERDDQNLFTVTPFFRDNTMTMMPSWMVTFDPNIRETSFQSYGVLTKYRRKLPSLDAEVIVGTDLDYTPSTYFERDVTVSQVGDIYTDYQYTGTIHYDYDADQLSVSPYVHTEWQAMEKLRLSAGLRYDIFQVDYTNNLSTVTTGRHRRAASQDLSFEHFSPKLGAVYAFNENHVTYANYRHAFRAPSVGRLFRSGSTANTTGLDPVKSDSVELGLRGQLLDGWQYDVAIYRMEVEDDIVSFINGNTRNVTNAGETIHQGIEVSLAGSFTDEWGLRTAWSLTDHEYDAFQAVVGFPASTVDYAGNTIGKAPETLGNVAVQYTPNYLEKSLFEAEWVHVGNYYTDETNTAEYSGHDILNLRASYEVNPTVEVYGRVLNVMDKLYSVYTANQVGDPDIDYRPGLPRTFYAGIRARF